MKVISRYIAEDSTGFATEEECLKYEKVLFQIQQVVKKIGWDIFSESKYIENGDYYQYDIEEVKKTKDEVLDIYKNSGILDRTLVDWIEEVKENKRHISHIERVFSDISSEYPIFYEILYRFNCIDEFGREFNQPYFTKHPESIRNKLN